MIGHEFLQKLKLEFTGDRQRDFFERVWTTSPQVYLDRLLALEFQNYENVLDAGCGYGQWTLPLASLNKLVTGIDLDPLRVSVGNRIKEEYHISNVYFQEGSISCMPFADEQFDAVFSYSVLYLTDFKHTLKEMYRVLSPGGKLYLNTNDIGWYIHNLLEPQNPSADFCPRQMAIDTLENTVHYFSYGVFSSGKEVVTPQSVILELLKDIGFDIIGFGPDASIRTSSGSTVIATPFYPAKYYNRTGVFEVLCVKCKKKALVF